MLSPDMNSGVRQIENKSFKSVLILVSNKRVE